MRKHLFTGLLLMAVLGGESVPSLLRADAPMSADTGSVNFRRELSQAISHAMEADNAGREGNAAALVKHAEKALENAKVAQRTGLNERVNDGIDALGEAIGHAQKGQTKDARDHVMHAVMRLSQAASPESPREQAEGQPESPLGGSLLGPSSAGPEKLTGEVLVKGEVLKIESDNFYLVKEPTGKEVHLLVGKDRNRGFQVGDKIEAHLTQDGHLTTIKKLD